MLEIFRRYKRSPAGDREVATFMQQRHVFLCETLKHKQYRAMLRCYFGFLVVVHKL
jgi:hypothetical protein